MTPRLSIYCNFGIEFVSPATNAQQCGLEALATAIP